MYLNFLGSIFRKNLQIFNLEFCVLWLKATNLDWDNQYKLDNQ